MADPAVAGPAFVETARCLMLALGRSPWVLLHEQERVASAARDRPCPGAVISTDGGTSGWIGALAATQNEYFSLD